MNVSVIVVSYNTREHLRACLGSLESQQAVTEVVVVDNASRDGSPEMVEQDFPNVRLIRNSVNRGFGAANNQGLEHVSAPIVLLLNSDCVASAGAIHDLAKVFEDETVVAAGGLLQDASGPQNSCATSLTLWAVFCEQTGLEKILPNSRLLSPYWLSHRLLSEGSAKPREVSQVMGACLMIRPLERFDEDFFLYCEDTDLCHRLRRHGRILYVPSAKFQHALGASSTGNRGWSVAMYNRGKEIYFRKHHGRLAAQGCLLLNRLGAMLRLLAGIMTLNRFRIETFWLAFSARLQGPALPEDALPRP